MDNLTAMPVTVQWQNDGWTMKFIRRWKKWSWPNLC